MAHTTHPHLHLHPPHLTLHQLISHKPQASTDTGSSAALKFCNDISCQRLHTKWLQLELKFQTFSTSRGKHSSDTCVALTWDALILYLVVTEVGPSKQASRSVLDFNSRCFFIKLMYQATTNCNNLLPNSTRYMVFSFIILKLMIANIKTLARSNINAFIIAYIVVCTVNLFTF